MAVCESKFPTDRLALVEPCKSEYSFVVYRQDIVRFPKFEKYLIAVTITYRVDVEPNGYTLGRHLYSVPLTPGEEVEIEIFRSSKVERELSQQYSTEVEFVEEFSNTCKYEWSKERTSNYKEGGGVSGKIDLGFIEFGGHYEPEYSETEREFERVIGECVHKTKLRVDRKFDVHIGLKTEVENRYRSTRKLKNPNLCRTLTYNYFQLMRKVKVTVTRVGLKFDYVSVPPRILVTHIPAVIRSYVMPFPEIKTIQAVREEKSGSGSSNPESAHETTSVTGSYVRMAYAPGAGPELQVSTPAVKTLLQPMVEEPRVLELSKEVLLSKMLREKVIVEDQKKAMDEVLEDLRKKFPVGKIVSEREVCINTNSMHVEPMMGTCLACEDHDIKMRRMEMEKARAELEEE